MVVFDGLVFLVSLGLLLWGSSLLVGASRVGARRLGVSSVVIGVTVLSVGTSIPEIATSVTSFMGGSGGVGLGNIVGSELVQLTLVLGVVGFLSVLHGTRRDILFYGSWMVFGIIVASLFTYDSFLSLVEGVVLVLLYVFFVVIVVRRDKSVVHSNVDVNGESWLSVWLKGLFGLGLVVGGSVFLLRSVLGLSEAFGVPSYIISFFVVGLGTSLPELFVSGVAAWRGDGGMGVGNLLGSNITDPLFSLGIGVVVGGGSSVGGVALSSLVYTLCVFIVVLGLFYWTERIGRLESTVLFLLYGLSFYAIL